MNGLGQASLMSSKLETMAAGGSPPPTEIDKLSQDFESLFVSMMLKTMRESMSEDMFAGDGSDTFGGMFDTFMGEHIAANGGIGLSSMFEAQGLTSPADRFKPLTPDSQELTASDRVATAQKAYTQSVSLGE